VETTPTMAQLNRLAQRFERIRHLCDEMEAGLDTSAQLRDLSAQTKRDGDEVCEALKKS
jgi:hypothetical protein